VKYVTNTGNFSSSYCMQNVPFLLDSMQYFFISQTVRPIHLSHPFSNTTFQNFQGISNLPSEESKFQHHTKLRSKCRNLLVSSVTFTLFYCLKNLLVKKCFYEYIFFSLGATAPEWALVSSSFTRIFVVSRSHTTTHHRR
jgi:hypothetical protein